MIRGGTRTGRSAVLAALIAAALANGKTVGIPCLDGSIEIHYPDGRIEIHEPPFAGSAPGPEPG